MCLRPDKDNFYLFIYLFIISSWITYHYSNQQIIFQDGTVQDLIERTLSKGGHIPELDILHMFKSLCEAILAFHSLDPPLAHRDIKVGRVCKLHNGILIS